MKNKEQSDAITSGHVGPKLTGLGQAPTSGVCGLWPQRHCLPFSGTLKMAKKQRLLNREPPFFWPFVFLPLSPP